MHRGHTHCGFPHSQRRMQAPCRRCPQGSIRRSRSRGSRQTQQASSAPSPAAWATGTVQRWTSSRARRSSFAGFSWARLPSARRSSMRPGRACASAATTARAAARRATAATTSKPGMSSRGPGRASLPCPRTEGGRGRGSRMRPRGTALLPPPPPPQNLLRRERWQAGRPRPAGPAPAPRAAGACGGSAAAPRTSLPVQPAGCQVRRPGPPAMNAGHAPGSAGSRAGAALSRPGAAPHAALRAVARRCFPAARSPAVQEKIQRRNGVQSKLRSRQAGAEGERDGAWRCKAFGCIRGQMGRPPTWSRSVPRRSSPESCLPAAPGAAAPDQPA